MRRTNTCGELRASDIGKQVCLEGWVRFSRDHGGVAFIDLADRYGITQVVFDPEDLPAGADTKEQIAAAMSDFSRESCVLIEGKVRARVEGTAVDSNPTGEIEVLITHAELLSKSKLPPFEIGDQKEGVLPDEDTRMKYRYLDLRRTPMIRTMEFRSKLVHLARNYLESQGFLEIETPILGRSTPEGARDYIIPSRIHPGTFYALPQSPQQFKQMLMVGGLDRYYQVARCFRDEDSRKDRQPEFTQLDMEMSFVDSKDIQDVIEGMMAYIWKGLYGKELKTPFPHIGYREAMERFGSDKPDMRYGLEFTTLTDIVKDAPYKIFQRILAEGGIVAGLCIKKSMGEVGRNEVDRYIKYAKKVGLGGLTWMRCENGVLTSNITKYFTPEILENIKKAVGAEEGDLVFIIAGPWKATYEGGGFLRKKIAEDLHMVPDNEFMFFWMDQNPMFEKDPVSGAYTAFHHPFVLPTGDLNDPDHCGGACFDLCLNGNELGSGSERIHDAETQIAVFHRLGLSDEKIQQRFDYFVEALRYGAPPHGGIAIGVDRLVAILLNKDTIREVIAFPKNKKAVSLLDGSPSPVDEEKLQELQIISLAGDLDVSDAEEFNPDSESDSDSDSE
ncbi:MAG: aspartate--tRNA ligase [Methanomethylophilus sp.]|jgi:aspartyl-tRNA synthetase